MDSERLPSDIDVERPSAARIYDYLLGGAHNFAVDRRVAEQMLAGNPDAPRTAFANRAFLRRAVQYLVDAGIRQFLDLGSGIPTVGHVHQIAQERVPEARVVYVDIDPIAVAHSRHLLDGNPRAAVVQGDARDPQRILDAPEARRLLDLDQPLAVLVVALLHLVADPDDPAGIVERFMAPLVPGSYVAISHLTVDSPEDVEGAANVMRRAGVDMSIRTHAQIAALFGDCELVEPGLVWAPLWHPETPGDVEDDPARSAIYAGVARKR